MNDKPTNQRLQEGALTPAKSPERPPAQATLVPLRPAAAPASTNTQKTGRERG